MYRALALALCVALPASVHAQAPAARAPLSDAMKAPRPKGGEWFGVYLQDKKVGYMFTDLVPLPGGRAKSTSEFVFRVTVGTRPSERIVREERVYEAKPRGRLLTFRVEQKGDGGEQTLEGTATDKGLRVLRKRPGNPDQVLQLPPSQETVEDADPARVAMLRKKPVEGTALDGTDLESYKVTTTPKGTEERTVNGVKVRLFKAVTVSAKENVPVEVVLAEKGGEVVEVGFGSVMRARAESEAVAKNIDRVEIFGLTRIVLPRELPAAARQVPGQVTLVVDGLPERFWRSTFRQAYQQAPGGKVAVTVKAAAPQKTAPLPLKDPAGGVNLKSTMAIESDHAELRQLARRIVGDEKDAYAAARKVVAWVGKNLQKDYGASADRATDVLRQMKGDCTEHSLLAVSLLRASGIPAKRVDGVVYMVNQDGVPALYWHEWVEAYVGEWTQLDPTFNQPVADAGHLALGEEGNAEITPLIGQLKVLEIR